MTEGNENLEGFLGDFKNCGEEEDSLEAVNEFQKWAHLNFFLKIFGVPVSRWAETTAFR